MRISSRRLLAVGVGLAAVATTALSAGPLLAHGDTGTNVLSALVTADRTTLTGTDVGTLTVSVHMTSAAEYGVQGSGACLCAFIQTVDSNGNETSQDPQALNHRAVRLALSSGSVFDGVWVGRATVGAINAGDWQVTAVQADGTNGKAAPATTGPPVTISGSHWPELTISMPQRPVTYGMRYVVKGTATWSDTHDPAADLPLHWGAGARTAAADDYDSDLVRSPGDVQYLGAFVPITTDAEGNWSVPAIVPITTSTVSFALDHLGNGYQWASQAVAHGNTARFAIRVAATGRRIHGTIAPRDLAGFTSLNLQRLVSGKWRHVATAQPNDQHASFSFTVNYAGSYRVMAAIEPNSVGVEISPGTSSVERVTA
jgi:hypothetical protein